MIDVYMWDKVIEESDRITEDLKNKGEPEMNKKQKECIQQQKDRALTVGDLKKELENYPDSMFIGIMGHYGEALLTDKIGSIGLRHVYVKPYLCLSGELKKAKENIEILQIQMPDPGPDPD